MLKLTRAHFRLNDSSLELYWSGNGIYYKVIKPVYRNPLTGYMNKDELIGSDHRGQFAYDVWKELISKVGYPTLVADFMRRAWDEDCNEVAEIIEAIDNLVQHNR